MGFVSSYSSGMLRADLLDEGVKMPPHIRHCRFQIYPSFRYSSHEALRRLQSEGQGGTKREALERTVKADDQHNQRELENLWGTEVRFGMFVQLKHVTTGKFVTAGHGIAKLERDCLRVSLEPGALGSCWIIEPIFKFRNLGDPLQYHDSFYIEAAGARGFLHISELPDLSAAKLSEYILETYEVNCAHVHCRFRLRLYRDGRMDAARSLEHNLGGMQLFGDDIVTCQLREHDAILAVQIANQAPISSMTPKNSGSVGGGVFRLSGAHTPCSDASISLVGTGGGDLEGAEVSFIGQEGARQPANAIWKIESENVNRAGEAIGIGMRVRIKHIASNLYLTLTEPDEVSEDICLTSSYHQPDARTLWRLVPVDEGEQELRESMAMYLQSCCTGGWLQAIDVSEDSGAISCAKAFCSEDRETSQYLSLTRVREGSEVATIDELRAIRQDIVELVSAFQSRETVEEKCQALQTYGEPTRIGLGEVIRLCVAGEAEDPLDLDGEAVVANQHLVYEMGVLEVIVDLIRTLAEPFEEDRTDDLAFLEVPEEPKAFLRLAYWVIKQTCTDQSLAKRLMSPHVNMFARHAQLHVNASAALREVFRDNRRILTELPEHVVKDILRELVAVFVTQRRFRSLLVLDSLCVCSGAPVPFIQHYLADALLRWNADSLPRLIGSGDDLRISSGCSSSSSQAVLVDPREFASFEVGGQGARAFQDGHLDIKSDKVNAKHYEIYQLQLTTLELFSSMATGRNSVVADELQHPRWNVSREVIFGVLCCPQQPAAFRRLCLMLLQRLYIDQGEVCFVPAINHVLIWKEAKELSMCKQQLSPKSRMASLFKRHMQAVKDEEGHGSSPSKDGVADGDDGRDDGGDKERTSPSGRSRLLPRSSPPEKRPERASSQGHTRTVAFERVPSSESDSYRDLEERVRRTSRSLMEERSALERRVKAALQAASKGSTEEPAAGAATSSHRDVAHGGDPSDSAAAAAGTSPKGAQGGSASARGSSAGLGEKRKSSKTSWSPSVSPIQSPSTRGARNAMLSVTRGVERMRILSHVEDSSVEELTEVLCRLQREVTDTLQQASEESNQTVQLLHRIIGALAMLSEFGMIKLGDDRERNIVRLVNDNLMECLMLPSTTRLMQRCKTSACEMLERFFQLRTDLRLRRLFEAYEASHGHPDKWPEAFRKLNIELFDTAIISDKVMLTCTAFAETFIQNLSSGLDIGVKSKCIELVFAHTFQRADLVRATQHVTVIALPEAVLVWSQVQDIMRGLYELLPRISVKSEGGPSEQQSSCDKACELLKRLTMLCTVDINWRENDDSERQNDGTNGFPAHIVKQHQEVMRDIGVHACALKILQLPLHRVKKRNRLDEVSEPMRRDLFVECYNFLTAFVTSNVKNQEALFQRLSLFMGHVGVARLDAASTIGAIVHDNAQLVAVLRDVDLRVFPTAIAKYGKRARWLKMLQSVVEVRGQWIPRNQHIVMGLLLEQQDLVLELDGDQGYPEPSAPSPISVASSSAAWGASSPSAPVVAFASGGSDAAASASGREAEAADEANSGRLVIKPLAARPRGSALKESSGSPEASPLTLPPRSRERRGSTPGGRSEASRRILNREGQRTRLELMIDREHETDGMASFLGYHVACVELLGYCCAGRHQTNQAKCRNLVPLDGAIESITSCHIDPATGAPHPDIGADTIRLVRKPFITYLMHCYVDADQHDLFRIVDLWGEGPKALAAAFLQEAESLAAALERTPAGQDPDYEHVDFFFCTCLPVIGALLRDFSPPSPLPPAVRRLVRAGTSCCQKLLDPQYRERHISCAESFLNAVAVLMEKIGPQQIDDFDVVDPMLERCEWLRAASGKTVAKPQELVAQQFRSGFVAFAREFARYIGVDPVHTVGVGFRTLVNVFNDNEELLGYVAEAIVVQGRGPRPESEVFFLNCLRALRAFLCGVREPASPASSASVDRSSPGGSSSASARYPAAEKSSTSSRSEAELLEANWDAFWRGKVPPDPDLPARQEVAASRGVVGALVTVLSNGNATIVKEALLTMQLIFSGEAHRPAVAAQTALVEYTSNEARRWHFVHAIVEQIRSSTQDLRAQEAQMLRKTEQRKVSRRAHLRRSLNNSDSQTEASARTSHCSSDGERSDVLNDEDLPSAAVPPATPRVGGSESPASSSSLSSTPAASTLELLAALRNLLRGGHTELQRMLLTGGASKLVQHDDILVELVRYLKQCEPLLAFAIASKNKRPLRILDQAFSFLREAVCGPNMEVIGALIHRTEIVEVLRNIFRHLHYDGCCDDAKFRVRGSILKFLLTLLQNLALGNVRDMSIWAHNDCDQVLLEVWEEGFRVFQQKGSRSQLGRFDGHDDHLDDEIREEAEALAAAGDDDGGEVEPQGFGAQGRLSSALGAGVSQSEIEYQVFLSYVVLMHLAVGPIADQLLGQINSQQEAFRWCQAQCGSVEVLRGGAPFRLYFRVPPICSEFKNRGGFVSAVEAIVQDCVSNEEREESRAAVFQERIAELVRLEALQHKLVGKGVLGTLVRHQNIVRRAPLVVTLIVNVWLLFFEPLLHGRSDTDGGGGGEEGVAACAKGLAVCLANATTSASREELAMQALDQRQLLESLAASMLTVVSAVHLLCYILRFALKLATIGRGACSWIDVASLACSAGGVFVTPFFFVVHMLEFFQGQSARLLLASATLNVSKLGQASLIMLLTVYLYAVIGFRLFKDKHEEGKCESLMHCAVSYFHGGLTGNGLHEFLSLETPRNLFESQVKDWLLQLFAMTFLTIFVQVLMAIFSGVIIDSFGELRDRQNDVAAHLAEQGHLLSPRVYWQYVDFFVFLFCADDASAGEEFTDLEEHIYTKVLSGSSEWLPYRRNLEGEENRSNEAGATAVTAVSEAVRDMLGDLGRRIEDLAERMDRIERLGASAADVGGRQPDLIGRASGWLQEGGGGGDLSPVWTSDRAPTMSSAELGGSSRRQRGLFASPESAMTLDGQGHGAGGGGGGGGGGCSAAQLAAIEEHLRSLRSEISSMRTTSRRPVYSMPPSQSFGLSDQPSGSPGTPSLAAHFSRQVSSSGSQSKESHSSRLGVRKFFGILT